MGRPASRVRHRARRVSKCPGCVSCCVRPTATHSSGRSLRLRRRRAVSPQSLWKEIPQRAFHVRNGACPSFSLSPSQLPIPARKTLTLFRRSPTRASRHAPASTRRPPTCPGAVSVSADTQPAHSPRPGKLAAGPETPLLGRFPHSASDRSSLTSSCLPPDVQIRESGLHSRHAPQALHCSSDGPHVPDRPL